MTRVSAGSPWCSLGGSITRLAKSYSGQFLRGVIFERGLEGSLISRNGRVVLKTEEQEMVDDDLGFWDVQFYLHFFNSGCTLEAPGELGNTSVWTQPRPNQSEHHLLVGGSLLSHVGLFVTPGTVACQAPLSIGFPRQEYWIGLLFSSPGDLPNSGIKAHVSCTTGRNY